MFLNLQLLLRSTQQQHFEFGCGPSQRLLPAQLVLAGDEQRCAVGLVGPVVVAGTREWPLYLHADQAAGDGGREGGRLAGQTTAAFLAADPGSHDGEQAGGDERDEG
jgi:hypothetical protein